MVTLNPLEITHLLILLGDHRRGTTIRPGAFTAQDALALREKLERMMPANGENRD